MTPAVRIMEQSERLDAAFPVLNGMVPHFRTDSEFVLTG
jgi:hypothetical protein